ncbi:hypothetical protein ACHAQJ_008618 [Trichoderma viride]
MSSSDGTAADASWERSDGRSRPAPTVNTIRRIRQACTNCRCATRTLLLFAVSSLPSLWTLEPWSFLNTRSEADFVCESPLQASQDQMFRRASQMHELPTSRSPSVAANNAAAKGKSPSALFPRTGVVDVSNNSLKKLAKAVTS